MPRSAAPLDPEKLREQTSAKGDQNPVEVGVPTELKDPVTEEC